MLRDQFDCRPESCWRFVVMLTLLSIAVAWPARAQLASRADTGEAHSAPPSALAT